MNKRTTQFFVCFANAHVQIPLFRVYASSSNMEHDEAHAQSTNMHCTRVHCEYHMKEIARTL